MCSKQQGFSKRQVELKIFFLLCCYCIIWTDIIAVNVATLIEADDYRRAVIEKFTCEAAGIGGCPQDTFEKFDIVSKIIAYILVGVYPATFLIYFVKKGSLTRTCSKMNSIGSTATPFFRNIE